MLIYHIILKYNCPEKSEVLSNLVWGRSYHVMLAEINKKYLKKNEKYKLHIHLKKKFSKDPF